MKKIVIQGGNNLKGDVYIEGSKNASLALIATSLLSKDKVIIQNVPKIQDVFDLIEIIKDLNVTVDFISNVLIIDSSNIRYSPLKNPIVKNLRASYYLMGVMLSLFNKCEIYFPGGCNLGNRPIDMHISSFQKLGVETRFKNELYCFELIKPKNTTVKFNKKSVGATINSLLLASTYEKVKIKNISIEPEVMQVIEALTLMGVQIKLDNDDCVVYGRKNKHGFMISVIPDRIEAGTYALIGAALAEELHIRNININHLQYLLELFDNINVKYINTTNELVVYKSNNIKGIKIKTNPYPGFPTDLQQPLTTLLTKAKEDSVIEETIYKDRVAHIYELNKMNAHIDIFGSSFIIKGNSKLKGSILVGKDLRGTASLVFAALMAEGESEILGLSYLERGYSNLINNLKSIGANIDVYEMD